MKFTKTSHFLILIAISLIFQSCDKFLDEKPSSNLSLPNTIENLQSLLDNPANINDVSPSWDEASADNYYLPLANYQPRTEYTKRAYTWQNDPKLLTYPNDWSRLYDVVNIANTVLDGLKTITVTPLNEAAYNNIKGSALFVRGNSFMRLAWIFALSYDATTENTDKGIVLRLNSDITTPSKRFNMKDSYNQIIADFKLAANLLPNNASHPLRPSKAAAYGMLARVYLSMRNYDSCLVYANKSFQLYNSLTDYNQLSAISGLNPFKSYESEVIYEQACATYIYINVYPTICRVDSTLYGQYSDADLRKTAYFIAQAPGFVFKGSYSGNYNNNFYGLATDEVLLMKAECYARLNNVDSAMSNLNKVLKVRFKTSGYVPVTATTPAEALTTILTERRKELLFRGLRWMDIKRLNKEGANITLRRVINGAEYLLKPTDNGWALPIPNDVIQQTGIEQN